MSGRLRLDLSRRTALAGLVGGCALAWREGRAQGLPDLIERSRRAVVMIGLYNPLDNPRFSFRGTGFAVGEGRHVVTCAHVLGTVPPEGGRRLVLQSQGQDRQWSGREVRVRHVDRVHDLALLEIDGPELPPLPVARGAPVREGVEVIAIGFPLGAVLGFAHVTHRGIVAARTSVALPMPTAQTLNEQSIAALRRGAFEMLQLDLTALPGNSGGPLIAVETGEVVGVVSMALVRSTKEAVLSQPSGISYAVPVEHIVPQLPARKSTD